MPRSPVIEKHIMVTLNFQYNFHLYAIVVALSINALLLSIGTISLFKYSKL